jgi:membrane-associated phospholipid phosphatase/2-polyprenyl-3-methyl-5-hydroxy-6-metoxy-1,4-benzoquinol methylase
MTNPSISGATAWHRQAAAATSKNKVLKSVLTTVFISLFFVAYFYLLKHPTSPPMLMPVTALDRLVSFEPLALPLYASLWVYVSILPAFFEDRQELLHYGRSMTLMCALGLLIFYFWPTAAPSPDIDWSQYPDMDILKNIDASGNACPSLHVATAVFSGAWFHMLLRRFGAPAWARSVNWIWCAGIAYSTLAIRQHVAVDVAAGLLLGAVAAGLSFRKHISVEGQAASIFIKHLVSLAAAPYKASGPYAWHFARGKLGGDPAFAYLLESGLLSTPERILDIGSGQGLLTAWLLAARESAERGDWPADWPAAPQACLVRGIELMPHDVARADRALAQAVRAGRAQFETQDMCSSDFGQTDAVVILDVLHYVPFAAQDDVLRRAHVALSPDGVLLLRVGDAAAGLPFAFSNWVDHVVTTLRGHRLGKLYCRPLADWKTALRNLGFTVEAQALSQGTPFANVLLVARPQHAP